MSKILIVCTGFKSNLFSSIQLADELRDAEAELQQARAAAAKPQSGVFAAAAGSSSPVVATA